MNALIHFLNTSSFAQATIPLFTLAIGLLIACGIIRLLILKFGGLR